MILTQERLDFLTENSIDLKFSTTEEVAFVEWCPGNGTRYSMIFTKVPEPILGFQQGAFAITDVNHSGKTMSGGANDIVHIRYVREKLELAHGVMQAVLINAVVGDIRYAKELFEEEKQAR